MQIPGTMSSEQACPAICTRISCRIIALHYSCFKSRFGVSYSFNSEKVGKVSSVSRVLSDCGTVTINVSLLFVD
ncbi:hypothetical protein ACFX12_044892 [Malus domestica]